MKFSLLDVRIANIAIEASDAALNTASKAVGPLAAVGDPFAYVDMFKKAQAEEDGLSVPWVASRPNHNRFWKKYITQSLRGKASSDWGDSAWKGIVPLRLKRSPRFLHLHPKEKRSFAEAFVWPTGVGVTWNNWIEARTTIDELVAIAGSIRNGSIEVDAQDEPPQRVSMMSHYRDALAEVRHECWGGEVEEGEQSNLITVISVVKAEDPDNDVDLAREALLSGLARVWAEPPVRLENDRVHKDEHGTVYVNRTLRLVWLPNSFLSTDRRHSIGCFHRNLMSSTLQVEMIAGAGRMFVKAFKANGRSDPDHLPMIGRIRMAGERILNNDGYSAPFLTYQFPPGDGFLKELQ